jgi:hypothetical protein
MESISPKTPRTVPSSAKERRRVQGPFSEKGEGCQTLFGVRGWMIKKKGYQERVKKYVLRSGEWRG